MPADRGNKHQPPSTKTISDKKTLLSKRKEKKNEYPVKTESNNVRVKSKCKQFFLL